MSRSVSEQVYQACSTNGYKRRRSGGKDATGTIEGYLDPDDNIDNYWSPGQIVTLKLYIRQDAALYHQVPAMIISTDQEHDIEEGSLTKWTSEWGLDYDGSSYLLYQ